jgi:hypothetical protein
MAGLDFKLWKRRMRSVLFGQETIPDHCPDLPVSACNLNALLDCGHIVFRHQ